jgi:DNA-binding CsgD family transcriptional regulator
MSRSLLQLMNARGDVALLSPPLLIELEIKILRMVEEGLINRQIAERIKVTGET